MVRGDKAHSDAQTTPTSTGPEFACCGRILLVDDEEVLLFAIAKMLRKHGFIVLTAPNGRDAVDLLRTHKADFSLLLLDCTLPDLSSREVLEEARRIRPDIPVVLTSAHSQSVVDASFAGLPIKHFIRKPYRLAVLLNLLQGILSAP